MPNSLEKLNVSIERNDWLEKRKDLLEKAAGVKQVTNPKELEVAGAIESECKKHIKKLDAIRKSVTTPLDALKKKIMAQEKDLRKDLEKEQVRINNLASAYAAEQMRIAQEEAAAREKAEREAAEEAMRLEEEARKLREEAERRQKAAELFGIEDQKPVPTPPPVTTFQTPLPEVTVEKPHTSTNRFVEKWDFEIVDSNSVPRAFCSPDAQKIRSFLIAKRAEGYKADDIKIAGIAITKKVEMYSK